eukprot:GHUV01035196.1.p1 GENE.GHUV01035196.1~~GHUV01035196.1.p1  ORF type:complete len:314 (+),score=115.80 GHUV01035196.1:133-1074(+)
MAHVAADSLQRQQPLSPQSTCSNSGTPCNQDGSSSSCDTTAGDAQVDTAADAVAGPVPGQLVGDAVPGQPAAGPMPGQPVDDSVLGQPAGDSVPGQPAADIVPGQPAAGLVPGQQVAGVMPGHQLDTSLATQQAVSHARSALTAFLAAERCGLRDLPELWFNRAAVALHLGDLNMALRDFTTAAQMDPTLPAEQHLNNIIQLVTSLSQRLCNRHAGLKPNQAAALQACLAHDIKTGRLQQLLPPGCQLATWQQLLQHLQHQRPPKKSAGKQGRGKGGVHGCRSNKAGLCNKGGVALPCRIAAVLERLPGCAQW